MHTGLYRDLIKVLSCNKRPLDRPCRVKLRCKGAGTTRSGSSRPPPTNPRRKKYTSSQVTNSKGPISPPTRQESQVSSSFTEAAFHRILKCWCRVLRNIHVWSYPQNINIHSLQRLSCKLHVTESSWKLQTGANLSRIWIIEEEGGTPGGHTTGHHGAPGHYFR